MSQTELQLRKSIDYESRLSKQAALILQQTRTIRELRTRVAAADSQLAWARRELGRESA